MSQFKLILPADLEPVFTNRLLIQHTEHEFLIDAFVTTSGMARSRVRARLILSPVTAKALHDALGRDLERYEDEYGAVHLPGDQTLVDNLFGTGNGEDE